MTTTVKRKQPIIAKFVAFLDLHYHQSKEIDKRANDLKKELNTYVEQRGEETDQGHLLVELPDPVTVGGVQYRGFMRQRKVSATFLEDAAQKILEAEGIDPSLYLSTITYVDQDKVARLYAEDKITEQQYDEMIDNKVTWAFVPVKA